ncbi:MAG: hypothetical protein ACJAZ2_001310 [Glaciecola sp.]|jgi:uncharacterized protein YggE
MKILNITSLLLVLLMSSCNYQGAPDKTIMKTMHLQSTGHISYTPNEAFISIGLSCVNKNISKSRDCLLEKADELQTLIKNHEIKEEDMATTAVQQTKSYEWKKNAQVFVGYKSSLSLQVSIKNLKVLEELYPVLLSKENISLGYLSYTHSNMDSLQTLAYQDAVDKANTLAEDLLFKMTESQKEILKIGNVKLPEGNYYSKRDDTEYKSLNEVSNSNSLSKNKSLQINSGTYYLSERIMVEYLIK